LKTGHPRGKTFLNNHTIFYGSMTTKKLVFECEKCGFDNHIALDIELDDLILTHKNKRPYPKRRKYLDSRDEVKKLKKLTN